MATGLFFFYYGPKLFGPHRRSEIWVGRYLLAGILMEGPEALRSSMESINQKALQYIEKLQSADLLGSHNTLKGSGLMSEAY